MSRYNGTRNKQPRRKPQRPSITTVNMEMVRALAYSPLPSAVTFFEELEEARKHNKGRQHRGIQRDADLTTSTRFYGIAARGDYNARRGRR